MPETLLVTGTGTEIGKTVATAAVAALARSAGRSVTVLKPAQTGIADGAAGDLAEVERLAGPLATVELARYPEPLAPATAARRSGRPALTLPQCLEAITSASGDLVLVEGAGGLLVRLSDDGLTLADVAVAATLPVLVVVAAGLGTLNATALTLEALERRGLQVRGLVVGRWPAAPGLADRCNLADLAELAPLLGVLPDGLAAAAPPEFLAAARDGLAPALGGAWPGLR